MQELWPLCISEAQVDSKMLERVCVREARALQF